MKKEFNDFIGAALIIAVSFYFLACASETPDEPIDTEQEEEEAAAEEQEAEEEGAE